MSVLEFSDGVKIDTSGPFRMLHLYDGWYVVGEGRLCPVENQEESQEVLDRWQGK